MRMFLSFGVFRETNVRRCILDFNHKLEQWSCAEWGSATAGECGEANNVAKKIIRFRDGLGHFNKEGLTLADYKQKLADEIADMVIYADLWAASQGIDLGKAVIDKFNRDSDKHGTTRKLLPSMEH